MITPGLRTRRPRTVRRLVVLADTADSMVLWRSAARDLVQDLRHRLPAVTVTRHEFSADRPDAAAGLAGLVAAGAGPDRAALVFSDGIGPQWHGGLPPVLAGLAGHGPLLMVHPLPRQLWPACGLPTAAMTPGRRLLWQLDADTVPIMELAAGGAAAWVSSLAGDGAPPPLHSVVRLDRLASAAEPAPPPVPALERFLAHASDEAIALARLLAAVPLDLAVMRLVRERFLPGAPASALAEVFLSGLLHRAADDGVPADTDRERYDFRPGYRRRLLHGLPISAVLHVLFEVTTFVSERLRVPFDVLSLVDPDTPSSAYLGDSYVEVVSDVLANIGGRYARAAAKLRCTPPGGAEPMTGSADRTPRPGGSGDGPPRSSAIWGDVPARIANFTGRQRILENLRQTLLRGEQAALVSGALYGLGGVGKTALAVEYAHRFADDYDIVWWVPAEDGSLIRRSLTDLAAKMGVAFVNDGPRTLQSLRDALRSGVAYPRWLLVFDNAEDPQSLQEYLPPGPHGGHVLITSRHESWGHAPNPLAVSAFERDESTALLRTGIPAIAPEQADLVASTLDDLPLALEQAITWLGDPEHSVEDYLARFESYRGQLSAQPLEAGYPLPVAVTFMLAFDQLTDDHPSYAELLELLIFFGGEPVAVRMLREGRNADLSDDVNEILAEADLLRRAAKELDTRALAKRDSTRTTVQVHRLVHSVLRRRLDPVRADRLRQAVQSILARANPGEPEDPRNRDRLQEIQPHVLATGILLARSAFARQVAIDQVRLLHVSGDFQGCAELAQQAAEAWTAADLPGLGPDGRQTLVMRHHWANALRSLGRYQQAYEMNSDTLARLLDTVGDTHEQTVATASILAADLRVLGDFRRARELDDQNRERSRRTFGESDINTIRSAISVGVNLRWLGQFGEARRLDEEYLAIARTTLGPHHPITIGLRFNLCRDLWGEGRYAEALRQQQELMQVAVERLGPDHPQTLLGGRTISISFRKLGNFVAALTEAKRNFDAYHTRFGPRHDGTLASMLSLANAHREAGNTQEAGELVEQALALYREIFGPDHPFTLASQVNLGAVLRARGEYAEAVELDRQTMAGLRAKLGSNHPYTLCAMSNLANGLVATGSLDEAAGLAETAYTRSLQVRGEDHPYTLACGVNLALDWIAQGRPDGDDLLADLQERYRRELGAAHRDTTDAEAGRRFECDVEPPPT